MPRLTAVTACAVVLLLVGAGCSDDSDAGSPSTTRPQPAAGGSDGGSTASDPASTPEGSLSASSTSSSSSASSTSSTSTTSTTSTTIAPTTTLRPLTITGGIVLVANGAGVPGAAAQLTQTFADIGFTMRDAVNAAGAEETVDVTHVYFREEARAVAESIAFLLGDAIEMLPMPTPPPIVGALEGLGDADVLVMLGKDLAGKPIPGRR